MAKLLWRVKLVTELQAGETTEVEVVRIERDEQAGQSDLRLRLAEAKQLTSALQAEIVPAPVTIAGEHRCTCAACRCRLPSKDITPRGTVNLSPMEKREAGWVEPRPWMGVTT
jgi:hypothetical protein